MLEHPAVRGIIVNWRDITDRKLSEEKLASQQAELLHASRLSTMGQMVATMSHEISQPLAALGNFSAACTKMLETSPSADPELFRGYVHEISRQAQRAGAIVKRLRAFGAKSTPDQELCDLNWLLRDSVELVASELRRHGVSVQWDLAEPAPQIAVDRIQLQQVIVNLLTNACDAMLEVDPDRRLIAVRSFVQHDAAAIEIIDRGLGLPAEVMKSLFQPFFTTKPDGMGLGLSICREIVEDHGGQIDAVSAGRSGATFRLRMPLGEAKSR
jgi:C4-dicarboxylate-specific signal transduction histidine kinase